MNNPFAEIMIKGINAGKTALEINSELKEAGAEFQIDFSRSGDGWTEQEMKNGFITAEKNDREDGLYEIASDGKPVRLSTKAPGGGVYGAAVPVMERDESRADTTITVGYWELSYDSLGYCYSRKNLRK